MLYARVSASTGEIVGGPSNAVVVSGARAMFSCETREATSTGLCWQRRGVNEQKTLLCNSDGCNARYSVDTSIYPYPRHSFMIDSVIATDSGRYSCEVCTTARTERTAHLIVIGRSATAVFERNVDWAHCWPVFCIGLFLGCVITCQSFKPSENTQFFMPMAIKTA